MTTFRSEPENCRIHASGWVELPGRGVEVTALWVQDVSATLDDGTPLFARLTYNDAVEVAKRFGARLISHESLIASRKGSLQLVPYLGTPTAETDIVHSRRADANIWAQLRASDWDGKQAVDDGLKQWIADAPPGWSRLEGWDVDGPGPGMMEWQVDAVAHRGGQHFDDGTGTKLERDIDAAERPTRPELPPPPSMPPASKPAHSDADGASEAGGVLSPVDTRTVRRGDTGPAVLHVQGIVGAKRDGVFGPATDAAVKTWQAAHGLVADGVFGAKSWTAAGFPMPPPPKAKDPRAPACVAALRDATARFPTRKRVSDGIMGDAAHQARPSGHNAGNAVDITHDPATFDCRQWADRAYLDPRVQYVIFYDRIINKTVSPGVWRPYSGRNAHQHHMHVEVIPAKREDASPWPWAP